MTLSTQPYKGARDFYPEDKRLQKYMFGVIRRTVEKYGYQEYDAPILEPLELYAAKTSEEVVNEQTYAFEDRGGRKVTIRPEMTPSVSRMVAARRQDLAYPLRWYSIPNLWRYERPQRGRLREHWQLNVDLFGVAGIAGDYEIVQVADDVLQAFGASRASYTIRLNSRLLVDEFLLKVLGLEVEAAKKLVRVIDRMHKLEQTEFIARVTELVPQDKVQPLVAFLGAVSLDDEAVPSDSQSAGDLRRLIQMLNDNGVNNVKFDPTLMRGFDYYTDMVFEVFDNDPENNRSMFGGGRYDGLVGQFGVEPVPTIGFAMGDVTLQNFLESNNLVPELKPETELSVVLLGDVFAAAQPYLKQLREEGVNVDVDTTGRKADKQIRAAFKRGVPYVLFIGEDELETKRFVLRNLATGQEEKDSIERVVSELKDYRNKR